jgi:hypothetical protein
MEIRLQDGRGVRPSCAGLARASKVVIPGCAARRRPGIHFATNRLDKRIPDSRYAASGMTPDLPVVPICRRHFCLRRRANHRHFSARPAPLKRGASRSSRTLGAGCGGRYAARRRRASMRTAKSCGPDASTLASNRRKRSPPMTVTKKPDHRGATVLIQIDCERQGSRWLSPMRREPGPTSGGGQSWC